MQFMRTLQLLVSKFLLYKIVDKEIGRLARVFLSFQMFLIKCQNQNVVLLMNAQL